MERLRIIVGGFLGLLPAGGVTWDYVQYPLGLRLLGHDVWYVEDTRLYPIYQQPGSDWADATGCVAHLRRVMEQFGFAGRWAYRDEASGKTFGMDEQKLKAICRSADVFINISCATAMREEYAAIPARVLIDSDPMFTQIQYVTQQSFTPGAAGLKELIDAHSHHFTFGENIHQHGCRIPDCGLRWTPTRQPVCLAFWPPSFSKPSVPLFTTLMNWTAAKDLTYAGEQWGQKDIEFQKFKEVPRLAPRFRFAAVMNRTGNVQSQLPKEALEAMGWQVLDPDAAAGDWQQYQAFLQQSDAEFSVAKHTYVKAHTGWFSCRSACYLAAGKPVVTQDTGWCKHLPAGQGLFAFSDEASALEAIEEIAGNYAKHAHAARQVAEAYFDSRNVLANLVEAVSQPPVRLTPKTTAV